MKKYLLAILFILLPFTTHAVYSGGWMYAIPNSNFLMSSTSPTFDWITSTSTRASFLNYASTTALSSRTICLTSDICRTTWPSSSGGGLGWASSTVPDTDSIYSTALKNVGIGTTSPYTKLAVVGQIVGAYFTATTTTASVFPYASTTAISGGTFCILTDCRTAWPTAGGTINSGTTGQMPYYAADGTTLTATSSIFISSSQFIGIGTTSPWAMLSVHHQATGKNVPHFVVASSTASATTTELIVSSNGNVGVNNSVPGNRLSINTLTASDILADVVIGTSATTQKGLVVQGRSSQTANLTEWQNSTGAAMNVLDATGNMRLGGGSNLGFQSGARGIYFLPNPLTDVFSTQTNINAASDGTLLFNPSNVGILATYNTLEPGIDFRLFSGIAGASTNFTALRFKALPITTPTAGFGSGILFQAGSTNTNYRDQANIKSVWEVATDATRTAGLVFQTVNSAAALADAVTIRGNGSMGIGTSTPNNKLDVYSTTKSAIGFSGASGDTYKWTLGMDVSNRGRFAIASSSALGTNDVFVIDGIGEVGIGTTSPFTKLGVVGTITADNINATSTTATSTFSGAVKANDYYGGQGGKGFTGTCTILGLTSITVEDGLITSCQ